MIIKNVKVVLSNEVIDNGYVEVKEGKITAIHGGNCLETIDVVDGGGKILMPGFIDIHMHGSCGIDFMDATASDYKTISNSLFAEGVTTYLATTLTSGYEDLKKVCEAVKAAKLENPSLGGIHLEGPYINEKYKGAQNPNFIRDPSWEEISNLNELSGNNIRYITLAPERTGALDFIRNATINGIVCSAGHSDASFKEVKAAIKAGLTNTTHTHNAMSGHHHRNPGIVTAAFYYEQLNTEFICDLIHVCKETLKTSYKIIGPDRFICITDALKIKNSTLDKFDMFGLPAIRKDGAAYLEAGPLAGSLLTMDQALRNMYEISKCSLSDLAKITSRNAARALNFVDRGEIKVGYLADFVLLDSGLQVQQVYKLGKLVYSK